MASIPRINAGKHIGITIDDPTIFPLSRVNAPAKAPNIERIGVPKNNVKARINAASSGR